MALFILKRTSKASTFTNRTQKKLKMNQHDYSQALAKNGYFHIPGVISQEEVNVFRRQLKDIFDRGVMLKGDAEVNASEYTKDYGGVRVDAYARYPELQWLMAHPKIVGALKQVLGSDYVILPESAAHYKGFGGWHRDTSSQQTAGLNFHWEPDFLMLQCALYLQDNTVEYGGGLDVRPGTHIPKPENMPGYTPGFGKRILEALYSRKILNRPKTKEISVPTKAGDFVAFDVRLMHKATWPKTKPIPEEKAKFALFFLASRNNEHVKNYITYIRTRPDYKYLQDYQYPEQYKKFTQENGLRLAKL